jgi:hypothetical protein
MRQYLDTSALIALSDRRDKNHGTAKTYLEFALDNGVRFVVGRNVVTEYVDGVTKRVGKNKGIEELNNILNSKLLVIEKIRDEDWSKAIEYFKKYKSTKIDLTDCISFSIMERLKLETAFTFDSDFKIKFAIAP